MCQASSVRIADLEFYALTSWSEYICSLCQVSCSGIPCAKPLVHGYFIWYSLFTFRCPTGGWPPVHDKQIWNILRLVSEIKLTELCMLDKFQNRSLEYKFATELWQWEQSWYDGTLESQNRFHLYKKLGGAIWILTFYSRKKADKIYGCQISKTVSSKLQCILKKIQD